MMSSVTSIDTLILGMWKVVIKLIFFNLVVMYVVNLKKKRMD